MRHPHSHDEARDDARHGGSRRGEAPPGGGRRGGPGRSGGWQQANLPDATEAADWLTGRLPEDWFVGTPTVTTDREEILVVGELPPPSIGGADTAGAAETETATAPQQSRAAIEGRISRFRESTRAERMAIAAEAETRYGRALSWGVSVGGTRVLFTHLSVPVMTRLRQPERQVLDTLVDAGVARSRSDALGWAVKLVAEHSDEWLTSLRAAMAEVDKLRSQGPAL